MPGAEVGESIGNATIADWLKGVSGVWKDADLLIGNLECPCVVKAKPIEGPLPELVFHAQAGRLGELAAAGFSAVTIANNHILNCGPLGLMETILGLDRVGIYHAGAGMDLAEALQPAFIPVRGLTVGLVAFCYGPVAGRSSPGAAPYELRIMRKALNAARAGSDLVIAALHDGLEYSDVPPTKTRARFRFLAENGADIVVGHHPHVLQGLEWIKNVPIAYSLGDFLFHNSLPHVASRNFARIAMGRLAPDEIHRDPHKFTRGAVLTIKVSQRQKTIKWHPFRQDPKLRPQPVSRNDEAEDLRRLEDLTAALQSADDPRHALSDRVLDTTVWQQLDKIGMQQLIRLALRPKWRYISLGLKWLCRQVKRRIKAA